MGGAGVGVAGGVVGRGAGVSAELPDTAVGASIVGGAAGRGAPVNRNTVPKTMLSATAPFSSVDNHQRISRFCPLGLDLLGITNSFKFSNEIIPQSGAKTNLHSPPGCHIIER